MLMLLPPERVFENCGCRPGSGPKVCFGVKNRAWLEAKHVEGSLPPAPVERQVRMAS